MVLRARARPSMAGGVVPPDLKSFRWARAGCAPYRSSSSRRRAAGFYNVAGRRWRSPGRVREDGSTRQSRSLGFGRRAVEVT